jgi:hypothetical protein
MPQRHTQAGKKKIFFAENTGYNEGSDSFLEIALLDALCAKSRLFCYPICYYVYCL